MRTVAQGDDEARWSHNPEPAAGSHAPAWPEVGVTSSRPSGRPVERGCRWPNPPAAVGIIRPRSRFIPKTWADALHPSMLARACQSAINRLPHFVSLVWPPAPYCTFASGRSFFDLSRTMGAIMRSIMHSLSSALGPIATNIGRITIWIFFIVGIIAAAYLVLLTLEVYGGAWSILKIGAAIQELRQDAGAGDLDDTYASHLLQVVIISLAAVTLLAAIISVAAVLGLRAAAGRIHQELRDRIVVSAHEVMREMSKIQNEGYRAQVALDQSVAEWKTRGIWMSNEQDRAKAYLRGYVNADRADQEIKAALYRIDKTTGPEEYIKSARQTLKRTEAFINNTKAFYLAALFDESVLGNEELVQRGLVPSREEARRKAAESARNAVMYGNKNRDSEPLTYFRFNETWIFVQDRMELMNDRTHLADKLDALLTEAQSAGTEVGEDLSAWVEDRRKAHKDLLELTSGQLFDTNSGN